MHAEAQYVLTNFKSHFRPQEHESTKKRLGFKHQNREHIEVLSNKVLTL